MTRPKSRPLRHIGATLMVFALLLSCGLTAYAAEEGSTDAPAPELTAPPVTEPTEPPEPEELFPADVQTVTADGTRHPCRSIRPPSP